MPYNSVRDLPKNVRNVLPLKAQRMYMHVYNNALGNYDNPYQIAWGVVSKHYNKSQNGKWKRKRYKTNTNNYVNNDDYDTSTDDNYDETTDSTLDYTDEYDDEDDKDDEDADNFDY